MKTLKQDPISVTKCLRERNTFRLKTDIKIPRELVELHVKEFSIVSVRFWLKRQKGKAGRGRENMFVSASPFYDYYALM